MKIKLLIFSLFMFRFSASFAQIITDTFANNLIISNTPCQFCPMSISPGIPYNKLITKYGQGELMARGIQPGTKIYGISYYKMYNGNMSSSVPCSLDLKLRSGNIDSGANTSYAQNIPIANTYITLMNAFTPSNTISYIKDSLLLGSFVPWAQFTNGVNMTIDSNTGWLNPMVADHSFTYTGGTLEISSFWDSIFPFNITLWGIKNQSSSWNSSNIIYQSLNNPGLPTFQQGRAISILYHSPPPPPCTGMPEGGTITGLHRVCADANIQLFLNNPSAGPGISYQWQESNISSTNWSNVFGATEPILKFIATTTPKQYRCMVTCNYSNQTAYSNAFEVVPHTYSFDSVAINVSGNVATIIPFDSDTSYPRVSFYKLTNGDTLAYSSSTNAINLPPLTVDSTYDLVLIRGSICKFDTIFTTVTIGCPGGASFVNTIGSSQDTLCAGRLTQLSLQDTLPNNYTVEWQQSVNFNFVPIAGANGTSTIVAPTSNGIYRAKTTCNISGNYKYSNNDTIWVTAPPIAGSITATNTTGNLYQFANNGMYNAQSYVWYFGDGDTSTQLSPIHHYNWAGNYTATLVATNTVNGCSDTATTQVSITTSVEALPHESSFSLTPNPFKESLQLTTQQPMGSITIYDAQGKKIKQQTIKTTSTNMDLKGIPSGVYLVEYDNGNKKESRKVVKE